MNIRLMTMADYPAAYALWLRTPGMGLKALDDGPEGTDRFLRRNPGTCFVAEEDGQIVGTILAGHDGRRGHLHHAAVDVRRQRQGIGSALVARAMAALEQEGIHKVTLVVFVRNRAGNAFWEKQGFALREDILIRDKSIHQMTRLDT